MNALKTLRARWTGIRPLLMHNGDLANPMSAYSKRISKLTKMKKKEDSTREEIARLEWEGSFYWDDDLGPVIPSDNIERCIQLGAQKSKRGKDVQAAVFCTEEHFKLNYDGPRKMDAMYSLEKKFRLEKGVRVQASRVIRNRPMFPTGWSVDVELEYDDTVIDADGIVDSMVAAGRLIGLGDWRPKFGRFLVEVLK